jgi:elongation factor G
MTEKLKNIGLVAHTGAGKTSIAEAMLFKAGVTTRLGKVEEGNTVMDFEPEELKRRASISTSFHRFSWKKSDIQIMDTPGDQNFFSDTRFCLQGADSALVVIDAVDGIKVQTELAWDLASSLHMPCCIFINKLDRERSDFSKVLKEATDIFQPKPVVAQLPIGKELDFKGVVDLVRMKAFLYDDTGKATMADIPDDMRDQAETEREAFIENMAEADDSLLERYLEGQIPTDEEIHAALKKGILERKFAPVLCGSAAKLAGIDLLMDFILDCMPAPTDLPARKAVHAVSGAETDIPPDPAAPFSALVIKTISDPYAGRLTVLRVVSGTLAGDGNFFNVTKDTKERFNGLLLITGKEQKPVKEAGPGTIVAMAKLKETMTGDTLCDESRKVRFDALPIPNALITYAVVPKAKGDEEKIMSSLAKLLEEDPALRLDRNAETKEILLAGMGQVHIEMAIEKMRRKNNVNVLLNLPKVPYRETIKKKVRVQGKHKKQTGGHGQFGDCWVAFEPRGRGEGFEFVDAIVGGVVPRQYIPAVEKGIIEACEKGVLAGFPTVDFRATLDFGSFHPVDSSEMAFKIAGSLAFKKGIADAQPVLLEPIMKVIVTSPDDCTGDIMGDLNARRGRVLGMDSKGRNQLITAHVPLAEIQTYAPDLNSMTGGRGVYEMEFAHYDEMPAQLAQKIIDKAKAEAEEA